MKTIIIGCGATMENGFGGPVRYDGYEYDESGWYAHALHTHAHCTTVDINPACSPSIVLDFATPDRAELVRKIGHKKFDLIVLESLPNGFYTRSHDLEKIVTNCSYISSEIGLILIPLICDKNTKRLEKAFSDHAFRLFRKSSDLSLIYPIISAFTGRYADEYMMKYKNQVLILTRNDIPAHYFLFKR